MRRAVFTYLFQEERGANMIEMVHTEFLKFKRRKIIFFVIGIILLFWAGMTFWVYNISEGDLGIMAWQTSIAAMEVIAQSCCCS